MKWTIYKYSSFGVTEEEVPRKFWDTHYAFYVGENDFNKDDWRLVEVKNMKKNVERIGVVENISFPIEYPLKTIDGKIVVAIQNAIEFVE